MKAHWAGGGIERTAIVTAGELRAVDERRFNEYDRCRIGDDPMTTVPPLLKALFSSKLRVKLLEHFCFHPGQEFHVRRLATALDEPVGTVARELARLERAGVLASHRVGNQRQYGLAENCPILDELRSLFLKTSGASVELRAALEKLAGVELAFLYGSYARGDAHGTSDMDLMIVGCAVDRELAPAVARVERRLKREISYTICTRAAAEKRLGRAGDFVHEVFTGPRILLIGSAHDRLFRTAR
jgi:predicted nucleotidyltransferase